MKKNITIFIFLLIKLFFLIELNSDQFVIKQQENNVILLPVEKAVVKNINNKKLEIWLSYHHGIPSLVHWILKDDIVEWTFQVTESGEYSFLFEIACPSYTAGGSIEIIVDNKKNIYTIPATKSWIDYNFFLSK